MGSPSKTGSARGVLTIFTIFFPLYLNTKSTVKAGIVGAVWLMYFLDYKVSIAAWVGMIALMGLDAETGVFMLLFLDLSRSSVNSARGWRARPFLRHKPAQVLRQMGQRNASFGGPESGRSAA